MRVLLPWRKERRRRGERKKFEESARGGIEPYARWARRRTGHQNEKSTPFGVLRSGEAIGG